jgi:Ca-activated chloride channel family protein
VSFAWPQLLWLLALPAALLGWELAHRRRAAALTRPKILRAEAGARSLRLQPPDAPPSTVGSARTRLWLFLALVCSVFALARPQWGRLEEPVFDQSREILLAVDLSRSMLAPDVKPSRLERAKLLIQALLEKLQGERVGLVVFAGTAFLQSPLSADYEILREFLPALGPEFLPQGGSNYSALLDASLQAFSATTAADRFLVILSDGEATDDSWKSRTEELKKKNIRVLGLGIGTAAGAMIPDGSGGLVKDERGAVVLSKLESGTLEALAQATGGVYRDASAWVDLAALVRETIEAGQRGQFVEKNTVRFVERFQWPLAFALWFFLLSFLYEFPVRPRLRDLRLSAPAPTPLPPPPSAPPMPPSSSARPLPSPSATSVLLLIFTLPLTFPFTLPLTSHAAVQLAPGAQSGTSSRPLTPAARGSAPTASGETAAPDEAAALAKIVGRLAGKPAPSARDWAELARETVTWGSRLQSSSLPVPEDPVRDALAAVSLGAKLDPQTADWKKLREELEALLDKKDGDKPDENENQNEDQQQKDQQKQDRDKQKQKQKKSDGKQDSSQEKSDPSESDPSQNKEESPDSNSPESQDQKPASPAESAFGDMNKKEQPPPPPENAPEENMQQVGGTDKPVEQQPADPALALPLQKLDQLRQQDSPAQLFQLMEGDRKAAPKTKKDW